MIMNTEWKQTNQATKALPRIPARQVRLSRIEENESQRDIREAMRSGSASEWLRALEVSQ